MFGGGYFRDIGRNEKTFYFMAHLKNSGVLSKGNRELHSHQESIMKGHTAHMLHVTLLTLSVNLNAPRNIRGILVNDNNELHKDIRDNVNKFYDDTFRSETDRTKPPRRATTINHLPSYYQIMGNWLSKPFVVEYDDQEIVITEFRMKIYEIITRLFTLNGYKLSIDRDSNTDHVIVSAIDNHTKISTPIYSIPKYDFGRGNWHPHISLAKLRDDRRRDCIYTYNQDLYRRYMVTVRDPKTAEKEGFNKGVINKNNPIIDVDGKQYTSYKDGGIVLFKLTELIDTEYTINMDTDISGVVIS